MSNVFIIHSYNAGTKESFGPYVEKKCKDLGLEVIFPTFPIGIEATYKNWCEIMDKYLSDGLLNEDSMIIAHSIGAHFIPKYFAERNVSIKLYISCAGFLNDYSNRSDLTNVIKDFKPSDSEIDIAIRLMHNRYSIYSDDDPISPQKELEYYADRFQAEKVFIPKIGHLGKASGITQLPEAIEIIKKNL